MRRNQNESILTVNDPGRMLRAGCNDTLTDEYAPNLDHSWLNFPIFKAVLCQQSASRLTHESKN